MKNLSLILASPRESVPFRGAIGTLDQVTKQTTKFTAINPSQQKINDKITKLEFVTTEITGIKTSQQKIAQNINSNAKMSTELQSRIKTLEEHRIDHSEMIGCMLQIFYCTSNYQSFEEFTEMLQEFSSITQDYERYVDEALKWKRNRPYTS